MGYASSVETLKKFLPHLRPLEAAGGKVVEWQVSPGDERYVYYKIIESLNIAKRNAESFPELAAAAESYRFRTFPGKIVGFPKNNPQIRVFVSETPVETISRRSVLSQSPSSGPHSAAGIIQYLIDHDPAPEKNYFPGVDLSADELRKLYRWTSRNNWLVFRDGPDLTVVQATPDLEPFAFNPEEDL